MRDTETDILYEDENIIVCVKPANVDSEKMAALLGDKTNREIFCVHRLDAPVGGVMAFAKTKLAAGRLSDSIREGEFNKKYLAVVSGEPEYENGSFEDLLWHDVRGNKTYVVKRTRRGVREARLNYRKIESTNYRGGRISLIEAELITGRSHQIRVQFASRKLPLWGDGKYGSCINGNIALFAYRLSFKNPKDGSLICFTVMPPEVLPWSLFKKSGKLVGTEAYNE